MMQTLSLRRRHRGLTLLEVMIASTIMIVLMGAVMALWISMIRQERTNIRMLRMSYQAANLSRELRQAASVGANLAVSADNTVVEFDNIADGTRAQLRYQDDDNNPATLRDNRLVLDLDVNDPNNSEKLIIQYVSPLLSPGIDPNDPDTDFEDMDNYEEVFRFAPNTIGETLQVRFRIGDRNRPSDRKANEQAVADDAFTGPGFQSIIYDSIYCPRNMAL